MALPLSPHRLTVTFPTATTAFVEWSHAADHSDLDRYEVAVAEGTSPGTTWIPTGSTRPRFLVERLKRSTQYTFAVRGVNADGAGDRSRPVTDRTPIASLHNALFFKACPHYPSDAEPDPIRVTEYGNAANVIRAVSDNDFTTFSDVTDYNIDISDARGAARRVDAFAVKGKGIRRHSGTPMGGSGSGWTGVDVPDTVKNWEGTDVSTTVFGFQHHLYLLPAHFTATSVRVQFEGTGVEVYEMALLEFGLEIDANGDFLESDATLVDRSGEVQPDSRSGVRYVPIVGQERDKFEIAYSVDVVPGRTLIETPSEILYWRSENRNCFHAVEPSRQPDMMFPATFLGDRVPVSYKTDDKLAGWTLPLRMAEQ